MALLDEMPDSVGILISVTRGKALVSHVEERVVLAGLNSIRDTVPLLRGGIHTSWVVRAGVQQENRVLGGILDILDQAFVVKSNCVLVVVPVLLGLQSRVLEDGIVIRPRGSRDVNGLGVWVETLEERTADTEGSSAGNGLSDGNAILLERSRVRAIGEEGSSLGESRNTSNASVLLVGSAVDDTLLRSANRGKNVRLASIITVSPNTYS